MSRRLLLLGDDRGSIFGALDLSGNVDVEGEDLEDGGEEGLAALAATLDQLLEDFEELDEVLACTHAYKTGGGAEMSRSRH